MRLFLRQLSGEMLKLFARKRTFIGFGAFVAFEVIVLLLLRMDSVQATTRKLIENAGYEAGMYLSGLTLAVVIVCATVLLLEALFLALVAGDIVGKEVEDGTMRMMLCRPVTRTRILLLKGIVCLAYTFTLTVFMMLSALLAGWINSGLGGLFVYAPVQHVFALHDMGAGLLRYLLAIPLLTLSLTTVTALAFCCSCFNMKPSAATVITLAVLFADWILKNIPYFEDIQWLFLTTKMESWIHVFDYRIPWAMMVEQYAWLLAINASLIVLGWQAFERRDFKS